MFFCFWFILWLFVFSFLLFNVPCNPAACAARLSRRLTMAVMFFQIFARDLDSWNALYTSYNVDCNSRNLPQTEQSSSSAKYNMQTSISVAQQTLSSWEVLWLFNWIPAGAHHSHGQVGVVEAPEAKGEAESALGASGTHEHSHEQLHACIGISLVLGFVFMLLVDQIGSSHVHNTEGPYHCWDAAFSP